MNVKELITGDGHLHINGESLCKYFSLLPDVAASFDNCLWGKYTWPPIPFVHLTNGLYCHNQQVMTVRGCNTIHINPLTWSPQSTWSIHKSHGLSGWSFLMQVVFFFNSTLSSFWKRQKLLLHVWKIWCFNFLCSIFNKYLSQQEIIWICSVDVLQIDLFYICRLIVAANYPGCWCCCLVCIQEGLVYSVVGHCISRLFNFYFSFLFCICSTHLILCML